jgi:hypothetical protein
MDISSVYSDATSQRPPATSDHPPATRYRHRLGFRFSRTLNAGFYTLPHIPSILVF